ncbi:hypothetical protein SK128_003100 [Halocaridina rubra]|uniref:EB domain-containing protein n=1 Tax=Halocaridina rubra TaxID=373956 RepID=A0AAN9ADL8_HALRR
MRLGDGTRKVGEPCWSHVECTRSQSNTHCHALVCVCDSGFHNHEGNCSRNIWEDLGLTQWELIIVAFVLTLVGFAIFVCCVYFVISKLLRFRKTAPAENLSPSGSKKEESVNTKKEDSLENSLKNIRDYETRVMDNSTIESQLVEESETFRDDRFSRSLQISEPVRFIRPLEYRSSDSDTWLSSRRSSTSQYSTRLSDRSGHRRPVRAWSATPSHDDSDDWFQPNRSHHRLVGLHSHAGTSRLPLLRGSTFSESDESP